MKFKDKQKEMVVENPPVETPPAKVITGAQLQEYLKNLQTQTAESQRTTAECQARTMESQANTLRCQGAEQMVELQIKELNPLDTQENNIKTKNGVN